MSDRFDEQVALIAQLLATVARTLGKPRQHLERQLGLSPGYLSKILNGHVELKVKHLVMLTDAFGMSLVEFFRLASPQQPARTPSQLLEAVRSTLGEQGVPAVDDASEFDARVHQSLMRILSSGSTATALPPTGSDSPVPHGRKVSPRKAPRRPRKAR